MIIYKLKLKIQPINHIALPTDAVVLSAQIQHDDLTIWYKFDESNSEIDIRKFIIQPTGLSFDDTHLKYIATIQQDWMVWHLFERIET